ncbi:hypothetical protein DPMN_054387 [Dreissena polymorpha]|uniref:Uncharacterized protein n=1 Tax=Dreissena polymorpha TaxID=45954 RepID=A0A9D4CPD9_DREPO|nr:hypothetical protein DPMN_054387 [Dreissena polymorpha]
MSFLDTNGMIIPTLTSGAWRETGKDEAKSVKNQSASDFREKSLDLHLRRSQKKSKRSNKYQTGSQDDCDDDDGSGGDGDDDYDHDDDDDDHDNYDDDYDF